MAKKTTPKTRNILVRDLDDYIIDLLEKYKCKYHIKADSKAVIHMLESSIHNIELIDELKEQLESMTNKAKHYWEVLDELKNAQSSLSNFEYE